jgi:hypothetical protein
VYQQIPIKFIEVNLYQTTELVEQLKIYAYDAYLIQCALQTHNLAINCRCWLDAGGKIYGFNCLGVTKMHVYSLTETQQNLTFIFAQAVLEGSVQITGENGQVFMLTPLKAKKSPLDIKSVPLNLSTDEIVSFIHEGRKFA